MMQWIRQLAGSRTVTTETLQAAYTERPSFTDYLPWLDIVGDDNQVLLEDGFSVAAVLSITPIPTDGRSEASLADRRDALQSILCNAFPEHRVSPWVVSVYGANYGHGYSYLTDQVLDYAKTVQKTDALNPFSESILRNVYGPHFEEMSRDGGLFDDPLSQTSFGGSERICYWVIYRRHGRKPKLRKGVTASQELDDVLKRVTAQLDAAQIRYERLSGEDIRAWLFRWMNPAPRSCAGDTERHLRQNQYVALADEKPFAYTLADDVVSDDIVSSQEEGVWFFDGRPHAFLQIDTMRQRPLIGQFTAERTRDDLCLCPIDQLPDGTVYCLNITITPQSQINEYIHDIESASVGNTEAAKAAIATTQTARQQIEAGNKVFPCSGGFFISAETTESLARLMTDVESIVGANRLTTIPHEHNDIALDHYIRHLPMAYDPQLYTVEVRSRLMYSQHIANMIPVWGRSTGTGNPGLLQYNRGGEVYGFDPLSMNDRSKNGHLFMFGPTGAGKSAKLVDVLLWVLAIYRPRIIAVEAGNSFGLLSRYLAREGLSTHDIVLRPGRDTALPPFTPALALVDDQGEPIDRSVRAAEGDEDDPFLSEKARDPLGEMVIVAKLMVTGGRASEESRLSQADVGALQKAIVAAAGEARRNHKTSVVTSLVSKQLRKQADDQPGRSARLTEMAEAMEVFTRGFEGELFNREGGTIPDVDFVRVEMGQLSGKNSSDKLSVAYIGIINQVIARAEATQRDGRPTILLTDESHAITTNPLLCAYVVELSKLLGRRLGLWLWFATQNMEDFPDDAEKMLAMFEWWICLYMGQGELAELERFKRLSDEQRDMVLSTRKVIGKYTEGVVLSDNVEGLFRNVPPALPMALAQTEKEEKTRRAELMMAHGVDELAAAEMIAQQIAENRRAHG